MRSTRLLLAVALAIPWPAAAEVVQLTTYYPSPSGVYNQIIATGNTFLARDSGSVGIGTASPMASLDLEQPGDAMAMVRGGANRIATVALLESMGGNNSAGAYLRYYGDVNDRLSVVMGSPPNRERLTVMRGSGFVGVNNSAPQTYLDVAGAGGGNIDLSVNGRIRTGDRNNTGGVWLSANSDQFVGQFCNAGRCDNTGFWTRGQGFAALAIEQNGSVGIGWLSPFKIHADNDRVLDVKGDVCGWNWWGHRICIGGDSWGNDVELDIYDNAARPSNNITFYNARKNAYADTFARSFNVASSIRYKKNVRPIDDALGTVTRLQGVTYRYKVDDTPGIGFIAEDVAKVLPEAVRMDPKTRDAEAVDYVRLVPILVEAVKTQQRQIEALQARLGSAGQERLDLRPETLHRDGLGQEKRCTGE